jgi:opacity protein-like surface antigen
MKIQGTFMTVALLAAAAVPAAAQSVPKFSLEPAAYYATVSGDDFEGVDAGMGFDVQGRVKFTALSLGLGWQRSSHGNDFVSENINASGLFVEPRYEFASAGPIKPYIGARLARVTQSLESEGSELKSTGFSYGAGAGIIMPLAGTVKLNTSASYNKVSYGNAEVDGSEIQDTDLSGSSLVLRVGVSLSFGR